LPVPVSLKRFFAPDLVFNLGIWLSSRLDAFFEFGEAKKPRLLGNKRKNRHGSPYGRAVLDSAPHTRKRAGAQGAERRRWSAYPP
jgi:hypothetical protein